MNSDGLFSFNPQQYTGLLLESARRASNNNGRNGTNAHVKLDNTGFVCNGRSYGAGASAGFHHVTSDPSPLWYQYTEIGIVAQATCERNESSAFRIFDEGFIDSDETNWGVTLGHTEGSFADGSDIGEKIWTYGAAQQDLFAMSQQWQPERRQTLLAITANPIESEDLQQPGHIRVVISRFNKYQCRLSFQAREILTTVNVTNSSMEAVPIYGEIQWPDWANQVASAASAAFIAFSRSDNGFAGSRLGTAMALNAMAFGNITAEDLDAPVPEHVIGESLTDFVTSVFDDMLVLISAGRIQRNNDTAEAPAAIVVHRLAIGEPGFICAIFTINWLIVLFCVSYILYTRAWSRIANLDFTDLAAVVLSTSKGGTALFDQQDEKGDPGSLRFRVSAPYARWPAILSAEESSRLAETTSEADNHQIPLPDYSNPPVEEHVSEERVQAVSLLAGTRK